VGIIHERDNTPSVVVWSVAGGKVKTDVPPYFKSTVTDSFAAYPAARMLTFSDLKYTILLVKPTVKLDAAGV